MAGMICYMVSLLCLYLMAEKKKGSLVLFLQGLCSPCYKANDFVCFFLRRKWIKIVQMVTIKVFNLVYRLVTSSTRTKPYRRPLLTEIGKWSFCFREMRSQYQNRTRTELACRFNCNEQPTRYVGRTETSRLQYHSTYSPMLRRMLENTDFSYKVHSLCDFPRLFMSLNKNVRYFTKTLYLLLASWYC